MTTDVSSPAEVRAKRRWIIVIVSIFVAQAALWTTTLTLLSDSPDAPREDR